MTADIEAIRARIAAATPEESGLIAHVPAEDLAALCDEVEALRKRNSDLGRVGQELGHALREIDRKDGR